MRGADLTERGMLFQQGAATAKAWMPVELKFRSQDSQGPQVRQPEGPGGGLRG